MILVTTNDSRIRVMNINDGSTIQKFKGNKNEATLIKAYYNDTLDLIISASDDHRVYIWEKTNFNKTNNNYEFIKPFRSPHHPLISMFVSDMNYSHFTKKLLMMSKNIFLMNMIVNITNTGMIQILINLVA
jgi:WD40 repeat protein